MPNKFLSILDLQKLNQDDALVPLIDEIIKTSPIMQLVPALVHQGISFKTTVRSDYPQGQFVPNGQGVDTQRGEYALKQFESYNAKLQLQLPVETAELDDRGIDHILGLELQGAAKGIAETIVKAFYYGSIANFGPTGAEDAGPGVISMVTSDRVVNAAGTTAATASSVYLITPGPAGVMQTFGNQEGIVTEGWRQQLLPDSNSRMVDSFYGITRARVGRAVLSKNSIVRAYNVTEDSGKGVTPALLTAMIRKLPAAIQNNLRSNGSFFVMSPRSAAQLENALTPTSNVTSAREITPDAVTLYPDAMFPERFRGIPIYVDDFISDIETIGLGI